MRLWRGAVLDLLRTALRAGWLRATMTVDEMEAMLIEQEPWADHCQIVASSKRPS